MSHEEIRGAASLGSYRFPKLHPRLVSKDPPRRNPSPPGRYLGRFCVGSQAVALNIPTAKLDTQTAAGFQIDGR